VVYKEKEKEKEILAVMVSGIKTTKTVIIDSYKTTPYVCSFSSLLSATPK